MKINKFAILFVLCVLMLLSSSAVYAQAAAGEGTYTLTYHENNCLATVPVDKHVYKAGDIVTVVFDPVTYKNGLTFFGWGFSPNGTADFGYSYYNFNMPQRNVDLYAICIVPSYAPAAPGPHPQPGPHYPDYPWGPWYPGTCQPYPVWPQLYPYPYPWY